MADPEIPATPRTFVLHRQVDVTGISGTGIVAWGVEWPDGSAVVRWTGETPSTVVWPSIDSAVKIHGHGGATRVLWLDPAIARERADLRDEITTLKDQLAEARSDAADQSQRVVQLELAMEEAGAEVPPHA